MSHKVADLSACTTTCFHTAEICVLICIVSTAQETICCDVTGRKNKAQVQKQRTEIMLSNGEGCSVCTLCSGSPGFAFLKTKLGFARLLSHFLCFLSSAATLTNTTQTSWTQCGNQVIFNGSYDCRSLLGKLKVVNLERNPGHTPRTILGRQT